MRVAAVVGDQRPSVLRFEPGHPDANAQGYVAYPQVDPMEEMTDLLSAVRAYELNASAVQATKNMIQQSLDLLRSRVHDGGLDEQFISPIRILPADISPPAPPERPAGRVRARAIF